MEIITLEQRIAAAKGKLDQLKMRLKDVESRKNALRVVQQKKDDTRRKILAGAWVLASRRDLIPEVLSFLSRPQDRALFDEQDLPK